MKLKKWKKSFLSLTLTLCMLLSLMPGLTIPAGAVGETVYPYYVITKGVDATEAAAGYYHVYKRAGAEGSFVAFTDAADADTGAAYSTIGNAITAVTTDVTSGSSATLQFGLTGTDASATGTLSLIDVGVDLTGGGTYSLFGSLESNDWHTVIADGADIIVGSGVTITNTCSYATSGGPIAATAGGSVTVNEGAGISGDSTHGCAIYNDGSGQITVNGGTLTSPAGATIMNTGLGEVIINGGTVTCGTTGDYYAIENTGGGTVTINVGRVESSADGVVKNVGGTVTIYDGEISGSNVYAIFNDSGNITVGGGTVYGNKDAVYLASGNITVSDGTVSSSDDAAIYNAGTGNVSVSGGTASSSDDVVIYNGGTGNVSVSGGTVSSSHDAAIYNGGTGNVSVSGGTISGGTYGGYNASTGLIYLSGADAAISGGNADIASATSGTIIANDGGTTPTYYSGDSVSVFYSSLISSGTTVAVSGVSSGVNDNLFSIANSGYYLELNEITGDLNIIVIADKWLDSTSYYSTAWYTENPNATSFTISTAAELAGLAYLVNNGTDTFSGDALTLANNLTVNKHEWTPIGAASRPFSGTFNGSGKAISGLYIDESGSDYQGLFGYIDGGAVKNLTVSGSVRGRTFVGGIVGRALNATIESCANSGTVSGAGNTGGIAGFLAATELNNCLNSGTVSASASSVGGIAGRNEGSVENCYNRGSVAGLYGGGITGYNYGGTQNCYNAGTVTGSSSGGVAGYCYYLGQVKNCYWSSGSASVFVGSADSGAVLSGSGTFSAVGAITAGTAANCGSAQTLAYGSSLLAALNKWVTLTNEASYLEWAADSGNVNGGYPVFGALHTQRLITGQPNKDNAYTVASTQVTGVGKTYQWYLFTETGSPSSLDLGNDACGTVLTDSLPDGFALTDGTYTGGHSSWSLSSGVYTSGAQGTDSAFSAMSIPMTITTGEEISFEWKVSSEAACDFLSVGLVSYSGGAYALASGTSVESISGETDWTSKSYSGLDAGTYYLVFAYTKDSGAATGYDCGYVRLVGTNDILTGNTSAQLNQSGLSTGDLLRCTISYSDGVVLMSDNTVLEQMLTVTNTLTGVTSSNSAASVAMNSSYTAVMTPTSSGYSVSVTVTMGGTDITSSAYNSSAKTISIANVTGNIIITATASAPSGGGDSYTSSRTIDVTETSSSLFRGSEGQIKAEANMNSAFSNSVEVKVTDTAENNSDFGLGAGNAVYPFDISLYIKGTDTKTEPKDGYAVTISLPVPDKLVDVKEQLSIAHKSDDGTVTTLKSQLTQINGVWYLVFEAKEFSPYALVVSSVGTYDETAGLPYYLDSAGKEVFIGFAANGKHLAPSGSTVLFKKNTKSFSDIGSHWAKDYIGFVTERELFTGTGENRFEPDTGMTRAMFATVIGRLYERSYGEITAASNGYFTDVDYDGWYGKYVDWAADNSIITGIGDNLFKPDSNITRQEMAAILYRFADFLGALPSKTDTALTYPDAGTISSWAQSAALYCQTTGIITGRAGGSFVPQATATRAEVAAIIQRFIKTVLD